MRKNRDPQDKPQEVYQSEYKVKYCEGLQISLHPKRQGSSAKIYEYY